MKPRKMNVKKKSLHSFFQKYTFVIVCWRLFGREKRTIGIGWENKPQKGYFEFVADTI